MNFLKRTALPAIIFLALLNITTLYSNDKQIEKQLKGFDAYVENTLKAMNAPSVAIAIVKNGKIVYAKGYGYRDVEKKLPADENTLYAIGSSTKAFTSTSIGILVDEGKLEWEKPVINYMPEFKLKDDYITQHITTVDMLSHRTGLPRHDFVWLYNKGTRKEMLERMQYFDFSAGFRQTFQYNNFMFMAAGYMIEKISGETWETFVKEHILTPLKMDHTFYTNANMFKTENYAEPYIYNNDSLTKMDFFDFDEIGMAPAGAIKSNVLDMGNWLIMNLNGGTFDGKEIIKKATLEELQSPQMVVGGISSLAEYTFSAYGMGWFLDTYRGHLRVSHGGNINGFTAEVALYPRDSIGLVVLVNQNNSSVNGVLRNVIFDRLSGMSDIDWTTRVKTQLDKQKTATKGVDEEDMYMKKNTKPSHDLKDYAGIYSNQGYGTPEITLNGDTLYIKYGGDPAPLKHYHYDVFSYNDKFGNDWKIQFLMNQHGDIDRIQESLQSGVDDIIFTKKIQAMEIKPTDLHKYVGEYDFGPAQGKIWLKDDTLLMASVPGQPDYELIPLKPNEFSLKIAPDIHFIFTEDSNGKITELASVQPNGTFKAKKIK